MESQPPEDKKARAKIVGMKEHQEALDALELTKTTLAGVYEVQAGYHDALQAALAALIHLRDAPEHKANQKCKKLHRAIDQCQVVLLQAAQAVRVAAPPIVSPAPAPMMVSPQPPPIPIPHPRPMVAEVAPKAPDEAPIPPAHPERLQHVFSPSFALAEIDPLPSHDKLKSMPLS